jgi:hypothetical protein
MTEKQRFQSRNGGRNVCFQSVHIGIATHPVPSKKLKQPKLEFYPSHVRSVGQKSIALKFSTSRTGSDVRYSCHHNSSPHSRSFIVLSNPLYPPQVCSQSVSKVTYPSRSFKTNASLPSSLMPTTCNNSPSVLTHIFFRILQLADPKIVLHVFLSLCTKTVSNYLVVK